jgi:MOSC domain-containing protein YiiM
VVGFGDDVARHDQGLLIGDLTWRIEETQPCRPMEAALSGRCRPRSSPDGGVCCNVLKGGVIGVGDDVGIAEEIVEHAEAKISRALTAKLP